MSGSKFRRLLWTAPILINNVLGRERKITSEPIKVEVVGKPQVLPFKANFKQDFPLHSDAVIKASFCSDPKPRNLKWQWGSLLLTGGKLLNPNVFIFCAVQCQYKFLPTWNQLLVTKLRLWHLWVPHLTQRSFLPKNQTFFDICNTDSTVSPKIIVIKKCINTKKCGP